MIAPISLIVLSGSVSLGSPESMQGELLLKLKFKSFEFSKRGF